MKKRVFVDENQRLAVMLTASLGFHLLLFHLGHGSLRAHAVPPVEIDITTIGDRVGLAAPGVPARSYAIPARPVAPTNEWTKPAPNQNVRLGATPTPAVATSSSEEPSTSSSTMTGNGSGEYSIGTGDGQANVLSQIPRLLNMSDVSAILQRFYPEAERAAGHEGTVILDMHIDTEGHVSSVNVVRSSSEGFDAAATKVAQLLHFAPAFMGNRRVNVKMRQAIRFKLET